MQSRYPPLHIKVAMNMVSILLHHLILTSISSTPTTLAFHIPSHRHRPLPASRRSSSFSLAAITQTTSFASHQSTGTATGTFPATDYDDSVPSVVLLDHVDQILNSFTNSNNNNNKASPWWDPSTILSNIDEDHERDVQWAKQSSLPFEKSGTTIDDASNNGRQNNLIQYEAIRDGTTGNYDDNNNNNYNKPIAIRTHRSTPLLNEDELQLLQKASQSYWDRPSEEEGASEKSRFTYQRKGNSEAHLSDVVKYTQKQQRRQQQPSAPHQQHYLNSINNDNSNNIAPLVSDLLLNRIYPWVREAYLSREESTDNDNNLELYIYDSLFIRYNATHANEGNINLNSNGQRQQQEQRRRCTIGAGQPLHRDLGYVSVNIMLNSQEEFCGGRTFFED